MRWIPTLAATLALGSLAALTEVHPLRADGEKAKGPGLQAGGTNPDLQRAEVAAAIRTLAARKTASEQTQGARQALELLRKAHAAGHLSVRERYRIAMLSGLSPDAEVLRSRLLRELARPEIDLSPFLGEVLEIAISKDAGANERVRWMLGTALSVWRRERQVQAAQEAGKPIPTLPLHGHEHAVKIILEDAGSNLRVRSLLAARLHWLGEGAVELAPVAIATAREAIAFNDALKKQGAAKHRNEGIDDPSYGVGESLAKLGPPIIPLVLPLLAEKSWHLSHLGRHCLAEMGLPAEASLLRAMRDPNPRVRQAAASALRYMDGNSAERTAGLKTALEDPDGRVRATAAGALIRGGPEGAEAVTEILKGPASGIRKAVIESIEYDEESVTPEVLEALLACFKDPAPDEVAPLLGLIDDLHDRAVPATYGILRLLDQHDDDMPSRQDLLQYLGYQALPWFLTALESDVEDLHAYAARGLAWVGPLEGELRERAQKLLRDKPDSPQRVWLAAAVANERDTVALRILDEALDKGPWDERHIAATTLGRFESFGTRYLTRLTQALAEANRAYYGQSPNATNGMVGITVDLENTWKVVAMRDVEAAFPLLDHEDQRIRFAATGIVENGGVAAAEFALSKWPHATAAQRPLFLELIGTLGDFKKVRPILLQAQADKRDNKVALIGARLLFERASDPKEIATAARQLAAAAVLEGNHDAWNALLDAPNRHRAPPALAAVRRYENAKDVKARTRARKIIDGLQPH